MIRAAVGFRVKSGWATVVLLGGSARKPTLIEHGTVNLSDPKQPAARQPFHPGLELPGPRGQRMVGRLVRGVERFARASLTGLLRGYRSRGHRVQGVGVVAGSLVDPITIGNDHIRAHAYEGRLFRTVIERAATTARLRSLVTIEKRVYAEASRLLKRPETRLRATLASLGKNAAGPWRAEEKTAALAAWMVLARGTR
ncbi:MAG: hypothetical protein ACREN5_07285 [Gemmatimonadales bacterium]